MYRKIGLYIRALRKDRNLTQEKLAETVGISTSFMGYIERGTRIPSVETLGRIADALDCSFSEIVKYGMQNNTSSLEEALSMVIIELEIIKRRFS